jgi:D-alanyl-D-alanine carboxypeptidase/D-alanyl-D-alanine-endopeptidase (penicillin-binding protein 4)
VLATVQSPTITRLIALTNTPSDNFFAEMLLKGLGARFGTGGSTSAGAEVVRSALATQFGILPSFNDGSGLSRSDFTSPRQVVTLLSKMATNPYFVNSLAVAGQTGTLRHEMNGTIAQGRCRGKTGTLSDVAALAGYCQALNGHILAFAFLMNGLGDSNYGHQVEANMAVALARYNG